LVVALHQGRLDWGHWGSRVQLLDRILDSSSPVFPDDLEFQRIATGPKTSKRLQLSRAEHGREIWKLLREARKPRDLERGQQFMGSDGVEYRIESSRTLAERLTEEHRAGWIQMIESVQSKIVGYHPTQEHIAELHFVDLFGGQADEALLRKRHDGYIRGLSRFLALALDPSNRYKPASNKRRGDSFDVELLTALAAPALVCTLDSRLRQHMVQSGSSQATRIVTPAELLTGVGQGTLAARIA
jgi:hypothetical protein